MKYWEEKIDEFVALCNELGVRMIMVGGGAVNFHGFKRHSADVDFWIDTHQENLEKLIVVFQKMGYAINDFPEKVKLKEQNISVKFSPADVDLELITNFSTYIDFDEAYANADKAEINDRPQLKWRVLGYDDLINSKIRSKRNKDLLDIMELKRIKEENS